MCLQSLGTLRSGVEKMLQTRGLQNYHYLPFRQSFKTELVPPKIPSWPSSLPLAADEAMLAAHVLILSLKPCEFLHSLLKKEQPLNQRMMLAVPSGLFPLRPPTCMFYNSFKQPCDSWVFTLQLTPCLYVEAKITGTWNTIKRRCRISKDCNLWLHRSTHTHTQSNTRVCSTEHLY